MCCFSGEGDGTADDRAGKTACPADNRRKRIAGKIVQGESPVDFLLPEPGVLKY